MESSATIPPSANDTHMALPAACATTPRIEKIPAPIIPPMPIETAAAMPIWPAVGSMADPRPAALFELMVMMGTRGLIGIAGDGIQYVRACSIFE